jgi:hypothetical protein
MEGFSERPASLPYRELYNPLFNVGKAILTGAKLPTSGTTCLSINVYRRIRKSCKRTIIGFSSGRNPLRLQPFTDQTTERPS